MGVYGVFVDAQKMIVSQFAQAEPTGLPLGFVQASISPARAQIGSYFFLTVLYGFAAVFIITAIEGAFDRRDGRLT